MENKIKIGRSFTFHRNLGNFESAEYFCFQEVECLESEAEKKSEEIYNFCRNEVIKSMRGNKAELDAKEFNNYQINTKAEIAKEQLQ